MSHLPPLIQTLLKPGALPGTTEPAELIQTHISYVLLSGNWVYKIKKPVDFGFLDFSSLDRRKWYLDRERTLNSRLAPALYEAVLPITQEGPEFRLGGSGIPVEFALQMHRVPPGRFWHQMVTEGRLEMPSVLRLVDALAPFYKAAAVDDREESFGGPAFVETNANENFATLVEADDWVLAELGAHIRRRDLLFLTSRWELFQRRVKNGYIREGHGDLRLEHVIEGIPPQVFDCIEFNDRFRILDVAADVAFLAMDLEFAGREDLAQGFLRAFADRLEDREIWAVLPFYQSYRAIIRAKVSWLTASSPEVSPALREKCRQDAHKFLVLAESYFVPEKPWLLITHGLSGTGKSTIVDRLRPHLGTVILSSDRVRKELAGIPAEEHPAGEMREVLYSPAMSERTYDTLFEQAEQYLRLGASVILDATFQIPEDRMMAHRIAQEVGASFGILSFACDDAVIRERLKGREAEGTAVTDATIAIYERQKTHMRTLHEEEWAEAVLLDTNRLVEVVVRNALQWVREKAHT